MHQQHDSLQGNTTVTNWFFQHTSKHTSLQALTIIDMYFDYLLCCNKRLSRLQYGSCDTIHLSVCPTVPYGIL